MEDRADIVLAGDVGGGEDGDDARGGADRVQVERSSGAWPSAARPKARWSMPGASGRSST